MSLVLLLGLVQAPLAPGELAGHALVYSAREKCVLRIGGDAAGALPIYRLEEDKWTPVPGSELPSRTLPAVAADERGNVLLHGGSVRVDLPDGSSDFRVMGDTWLWDGSSWKQVATSGPAPRDHHAMVFDSKRRVFVLFGGSDADPSGRTTLYGDTWEWRSERWELVAEHGPAPRAHHAMIFDAVRARTILLGGADDARTWAWDGTRWSVAARGAPANRSSPRLAWDPKSARVLLFGGDSADAYPADTWAWNGTTWSVIATSGPPGRSVHGLAYDETQGALILFGGADRTHTFGDLWRFASDAWTPLAAKRR
jgi:hypothetical protein